MRAAMVRRVTRGARLHRLQRPLLPLTWCVLTRVPRVHKQACAHGTGAGARAEKVAYQEASGSPVTYSRPSSQSSSTGFPISFDRRAFSATASARFFACARAQEAAWGRHGVGPQAAHSTRLPHAVAAVHWACWIWLFTATNTVTSYTGLKRHAPTRGTRAQHSASTRAHTHRGAQKHTHKTQPLAVMHAITALTTSSAPGISIFGGAGGRSSGWLLCTQARERRRGSTAEHQS